MRPAGKPAGSAIIGSPSHGGSRTISPGGGIVTMMPKAPGGGTLYSPRGNLVAPPAAGMMAPQGMRQLEGNKPPFAAGALPQLKPQISGGPARLPADRSLRSLDAVSDAGMTLVAHKRKTLTPDSGTLLHHSTGTAEIFDPGSSLLFHPESGAKKAAGCFQNIC